MRSSRKARLGIKSSLQNLRESCGRVAVVLSVVCDRVLLEEKEEFDDRGVRMIEHTGSLRPSIISAHLAYIAG